MYLAELALGQSTERNTASLVKTGVSYHCGYDLGLSFHAKDGSSYPSLSTKSDAEIVIKNAFVPTILMFYISSPNIGPTSVIRCGETYPCFFKKCLSLN